MNRGIRLCCFDYTLFEEEEYKDDREGIYGYPYFKHLIEFFPRVCRKQLNTMNKVVGQHNGRGKEVRKTQFTGKFSKNEFLNCIGCIIFTVAYRNK